MSMSEAIRREWMRARIRDVAPARLEITESAQELLRAEVADRYLINPPTGPVAQMFGMAVYIVPEASLPPCGWAIRNPDGTNVSG
jgi:hypothetical protein